MGKTRRLIILSIAFGIIAVFLTLLEFLALNDIKKEYVSPQIIQKLNLAVSPELPEWTATKGEWGLVAVSYFSRLFYFFFSIAVLIMIFKRPEKDTED